LSCLIAKSTGGGRLINFNKPMAKKKVVKKAVKKGGKMPMKKKAC
jgi:copper(I)-binding protein